MKIFNKRIVRCLMVLMAGFLLHPIWALAQCSVEPSPAVRSAKWDAIFTQDGPGKGLEPAGAPGWTGGDSTYSLLLPNGDTAFFFSDSYISESTKMKGDGTVTRNANGLRTTELNCFPPICDPVASSFIARNSIVILSKDGKTMKTLVGPKNDKGLSTSYFKDPAEGLNYWVGDAIIMGKKTLFLFLLKFDPKLEFHGASVVQLNPNTLAIEKFIDIKNMPGLQIHWGTSMLIEGEHLYIYGKGTVNGKKLGFVSRTDADTGIEKLADTTTWEAWNGKAWTKDLTTASPIVPATDSISDEFDVAKFTVNGRPIYLIAALDTSVPFGKWSDITLYSSCSPEGPFTGKLVVYAAPEAGAMTVPGIASGEKLKAHLVLYNPHIHTQFSGSGRILVSYNLNRYDNSDSIYIDGYRPRFIEIPIAGLK